TRDLREDIPLVVDERLEVHRNTSTVLACSNLLTRAVQLEGCRVLGALRNNSQCTRGGAVTTVLRKQVIHSCVIPAKVNHLLWQEVRQGNSLSDLLPNLFLFELVLLLYLDVGDLIEQSREVAS